jgi:competence protein ComEC
VLINPSYIWGDLGWQLSFAAFAGVMILAPLMQRYFFGDVKPGIVRQIMGETISATIVTAPILISAFGQISNISLVANLLVLPLVPLAMLLTFIAGLGSIIFAPLAMLIGLPATWLLGYMVAVAKNLSELSWATSVFSMSGFGVAVCYCVIIIACVLLWRSTKLNLGESNIVE